MAVTAEVDIMNSALIKLGAERIISPDDANNRARLVKEQYPKVRDALLRAHPWHFNKAYSSLALVTPKPTDVFDYDYVFQLPNDVSRIFETNLGYDTRWEQLENNRVGTDAGAMIIKYGRRLTDVTKFDDSFIEVLAWALAADICYALTQSTSAAEKAMASYKEMLMGARSFNAQVGSVKRVISDEWLDTRR